LASRSSRAPGALAAALAVALAGCPNREPESRPFRIAAEVTGGARLESLSPEAAYYVLFGTGAVLGPTSLRLSAVTLATGPAPFDQLTLSFDGGAAPEAIFGPELDGVPLRVLVLVDPEATGPKGEPLPIPGFRVATGASPDFRHRLLLWESTYAGEDGVAVLFAPALPHVDDPPFLDFPDFLVEDVNAAWEPAECGLVYYDVLNAFGETESDDAVLESGERARVPIGAAEPPWDVSHVQSWHRDGRCAGQAQAFSQIAAWRRVAAAP
jgi:hypothetical protein